MVAIHHFPSFRIDVSLAIAVVVAGFFLITKTSLCQNGSYLCGICIHNCANCSNLNSRERNFKSCARVLGNQEISHHSAFTRARNWFD
uniref:Secreted protein n=1 Tax=Ditylenchus dipsaci TaxID=166011 RepID=A0A915EKS3_9BILA